MLKLNVEAVAHVKDAALYVVVTDLQSDPDDSITWKLVGNGKVRAAQVRKGQLKTIGRMLTQTLREREVLSLTHSLTYHSLTLYSTQRS